MDWNDLELPENEVRVYLASSWKNVPSTNQLAEVMRRNKLQVYCFSEIGEGQFHFNWKDIDKPTDDGISCLEYPESKRGFENDKWFLDWANTCVLYLPSGRDSHLEAGYIKGKGGRLLIVQFGWVIGEYSNMYHLSDGLYDLTKDKDILRFWQDIRCLVSQ